MEYGDNHNRPWHLDEQYAVGKTFEQLATDLTVNDNIGFRLTHELSQDRFQTSEKFTPEPAASLLVPINRLLHIFFRLRAKDHAPSHERYRNLALTSSQETPASGSLTMFWSRRSNSRRCASVSAKA